MAAGQERSWTRIGTEPGWGRGSSPGTRVEAGRCRSPGGREMPAGAPSDGLPGRVSAEMGSDPELGLDAWNTEMAGEGDGEARIR